MSEQPGSAPHCWDTRPGLAGLTGTRLPPIVRSTVERPVVGFSFYVLLLLLAYLFVELCVGAASAVPFDTYSSSFVLPQALASFGWTARLLILGFALVIAVFDTRLLRWHEFEGGQALRIGFGLLAATMAWPLVTYGYNYAVDSAHTLDRLLVLATFLLMLWRPAFVLPFLLIAYIVFSQVTAPSLGGSVVPHKTQVLRALQLFAAFYLVRVVFGYHRTSGLVYLLGCFVAAAYWLPAWAKLQLDWLFGNQLNMIPLGAYAHGWRGNLPVSQIVEQVHSLEAVAPWFQALALLVEAAFVAFFFSRRLAIALLVAATVFHFGVFYLFGFLFWTWIVLDIVLAGLLIATHRAGRSTQLFGLSFVPLAAALIVAGPYWARPPALAWYDTPLSYTYTVEATLDTGERVRLNPKFFAPYEDAFTMAGFSYLSPAHGLLVGPYGVTQDSAVTQGLDQAQSWGDVLALERAIGRRGFDEPRAGRFYRFLHDFVQTRNERGDRLTLLYALHPPGQFWSDIDGIVSMNSVEARGAKWITHVTVKERTHFFDGKSLQMERELTLKTLTMTEPLKTPGDSVL